MSGAARFHVTASGESHFAWLRTRLAVERTFMAWLRTAASMIGFGFTIVEFFAKFSTLNGVAPARAPLAPRALGLGLIGTGVASLVIALRQFRRTMHELESAEFAAVADARKPRSAGVLVAVALLAIGIFAFVAILIRLH